MTLDRRLLGVLGIAAAVLLGAAQTLIAYRYSPLAALVAPIAITGGIAILWRPLIGVHLGLLAVPLELVDVRFGGEAGLSPAEAILLVTAAAFAAHAVVGERPQPPQPTHIAFAGLLAVVALGVLFAEDTFLVGKILAMWTGFLLVSMLVADSRGAQVERLAFTIGLTGAILSLIAILTTGEQEAIRGGAVVSGRAQASFEHPGVLSFFLAVTLPPALVLGLHRSGPARVLMLGASGLIIAALMLSLTRGAILGTGAALIVLLAWAPFRRAIAALLALVVVIALFNIDLLGTEQFSIVSERFSTLSRLEQTTGSRFQIWAATPDIVADHLVLGVGMGNFSIVSPRYGLSESGGEPFDHAHNLPLTVAAELGVVGLGLLIAFVVALARAAMTALRDRAGPHFPLALAFTASIIGLAVVSVGDYPPRTNVIMATFMIEVGALLALARIAQAAKPPTTPTEE